MTTDTDHSFMNELCDDLTLKPWSVDGFDCATTRSALLMMPGATFAENKEAPQLAKVLAVPLEKVATGVHFLSLRDWALLAGSLHDCCDTCGCPQDFPRTVRGSLAGRLVNRCLLHHFFRHLRTNTVDISVGSESEPLLIECPEWRLFVMPLKTSEFDSFEFPILERAAGVKAVK